LSSELPAAAGGPQVAAVGVAEHGEDGVFGAVVVATEIEDPAPAARETDVINFSCKIYSQIIASSYRSILFL